MQSAARKCHHSPDPENPLLVQGLKMVMEEGITMDECKMQPKHTVINYPMGLIDECLCYLEGILCLPYRA